MSSSDVTRRPIDRIVYQVKEILFIGSVLTDHCRREVSGLLVRFDSSSFQVTPFRY